MSMYDSILLKIKCPDCNEISEMELQTKDLLCDLNLYSVNDYISDQFNYLNCITHCHLCLNKNKSIKLFDVKVFLEDGKITNNYEMC